MDEESDTFFEISIFGFMVPILGLWIGSPYLSDARVNGRSDVAKSRVTYGKNSMK